jgi:predicted alpha/beta hydrolase family esterase
MGDGVAPKDANLSAAVAKVCKVVKLQHEPVLLVGHSQAGAIITQATNSCADNIAGLVYVAAVVPLSGEKAFDLLSVDDNNYFNLVTTMDADKGQVVPNLNSPIKKIFIGDGVTDAVATLAVLNMVAEPIALGDETLNYDQSKFAQIPKFYVKTANDLIISPETQNKYLQRVKFNLFDTFYTGHSPFVTAPKDLADHFEYIALKELPKLRKT